MYNIEKKILKNLGNNSNIPFLVAHKRRRFTKKVFLKAVIKIGEKIRQYVTHQFEHFGGGCH